METASLIDLPPELVTMVVNFLMLQNVRICVQVCRAWKALFQPLLWRHVDLILARYVHRRWISFSTVLRTVGPLVQSVRLNGKAIPDDVQQDLVRVFPHLSSFEFIGRTSSDFDVESFIARRRQGWERLIFRFDRLSAGATFGSNAALETLNHAATLVVLRMEGAGFMRNSTIGQLLSGLPHLKEFYTLGVIRIDGFRNWEEQWADSADLVLSEWVCTNLEVFGCDIRGMPRRDTIRRGRDGSTSSNAMTEEELESIEVQRRVCAQLGKLTKLKELSLRVLCPVYQDERILRRLGRISTVRNWRRFLHHRFHDCLAMSLECGLDLLGNLKELRRVGLEDMDVDIGNPAEQAWVAENWPLATIVYSRHSEAVLENNDDSDQDEESDDDVDDESDEDADGDNVSNLHNDKCDLDNEFCNCIVDFLAE